MRDTQGRETASESVCVGDGIAQGAVDLENADGDPPVVAGVAGNSLVEGDVATAGDAELGLLSRPGRGRRHGGGRRGGGGAICGAAGDGRGVIKGQCVLNGMQNDCGLESADGAGRLWVLHDGIRHG